LDVGGDGDKARAEEFFVGGDFEFFEGVGDVAGIIPVGEDAIDLFFEFRFRDGFREGIIDGGGEDGFIMGDFVFKWFNYFHIDTGEGGVGIIE